MDPFFEKINFPYESVRKGQDDFIKLVDRVISENKNVMISAPTGLGKTISGLAPALYYAKKKGLTVICLTSRQTQVNQIIKTVKDISNKSKEKINFMAFIGKRNMCVHSDRELYSPMDFNDFCKKVRETGKCKFYKNVKNVEYEETRMKIIKETSNSFLTVENFVKLSGSPSYQDGEIITGFCPYELAGIKAFKSDLVICDFNYLFSAGIRENFLGKIGRTLEECIVIVDEAHNLPDRIRNAHSFTLSTEMIRLALKELGDFFKTDKYDAYVKNIKSTIEEIYFDKVLGEKKDYLLNQSEFSDIYLAKFNKLHNNFSKIIDELREAEALIKEDRVISHVGRLANFLEKWWTLDEESYLRIIEKDIREDKTILSLKIKCIDPSDLAGEILNKSFSSILMSGTLSPINMYKDILGIANCETLELDSPFSNKRQLTLVIDDVTTKYSARSFEMYERIANHVVDLLFSVHDKNAIIFFPSYDFMERVLSNINLISLERKVLKEQRYMTKEQKEEFVDNFKSKSGFENKSKVLFAITSGSFAEGLDLPNEALELVGIVGLPLGVPDIFTNAVIRHFDKKFAKGQMYGYIHPAMSKIVQAAGRCIRTETDKGVVVLIDTRFIWPLYAQTFPKHWKLKVVDNYKLEIANFFEKEDPMSF
ncbi:MAG: ATP-dependent DNA helicase [Nanoarchaeota archaeon]|nr:ATP-dependent DNA helicase [Nanoarchaeota archaeon]